MFAVIGNDKDIFVNMELENFGFKVFVAKNRLEASVVRGRIKLSRQPWTVPRLDLLNMAKPTVLIHYRSLSSTLVLVFKKKNDGYIYFFNSRFERNAFYKWNTKQRTPVHQKRFTFHRFSLRIQPDGHGKSSKRHGTHPTTPHSWELAKYRTDRT